MTKPGPSDPRDPQGPAPKFPPEGRVRERKDPPSGVAQAIAWAVNLAHARRNEPTFVYWVEECL